VERLQGQVTGQPVYKLPECKEDFFLQILYFYLTIIREKIGPLEKQNPPGTNALLPDG